jgi:hypothetical protein
VNLRPRFRNRRLRVGSQIVIEVLRPGYVGKYYRFTIRDRRGPRTEIDCIGPGSKRPGVGC